MWKGDIVLMQGLYSTDYGGYQQKHMSSFSFSAARSVVACISHPGFLVLSRAWCGYVWQYLVKCNSFLKILGDRPENKGFDIPIVTSVLGDSILLNKFMAVFLRELNAFHNTYITVIIKCSPSKQFSTLDFLSNY